MSEETNPEEPLLKQYLKEVVEALREREKGIAAYASEQRQLGKDFEGPASVIALPDSHTRAYARADEAEQRLALTRAALAFWERLAAAWRVEVVDHPGENYADLRLFRLTGTAENLHHESWIEKTGQAWGLMDGNVSEAEAVISLAAVLECRRRNEVGR